MTFLDMARSALGACEISEISEISLPLNPGEAKRRQAAIIAPACGACDQLDFTAFDRRWACWKAHEAGIAHVDAEREMAA